MHKLPSGNYAHDIRRKISGVPRRWNLSLRTSSYREALTRKAALDALTREGAYDVLDALTAGTLDFPAVVRALAPRGPGIDALRPKSTTITVSHACAALLRELSHSPPNTQSIARVVTGQLRAHFGDATPLSTITFAAAQSWLRNPAWSARTQLQKQQYAKKVWTVAEHLSGSPIRNPFTSLRPMAKERTSPRGFLELREALAMLILLPQGEAAFLACGFLGTMRIGEACNLRWSDIDFDTSTIAIVPRKDWHPKTRASARTIEAPERLLDLLAALPQRGSFVFGGSKPLPQRTAERLARRALDRAGHRELTFHSGRHSAITHLVASGIPLPEVSRQAGVSTETLLSTYAHAIPEQRAATRKAFDIQ